ncbi:ABC transporter ATP-binding protein [candidate division KSB1 bacterium]|nr:ABC transporter ATP-binding protein [candidate division KSB1 bacterium]
MIEIRNLFKSFIKDNTPLHILEDISLTVSKGEYVAVQGPSGCGKTTLLLTAGGLLRPEKGEVLVNQKNIYELDANERAIFRAQNIGFVFQQYHLIPYLTVLENVLTPALARNQDESLNRASALIEQFGLTHRLNHLPAELSAGEKQRVALARAVLFQPAVLLADEITGNLDDKNANLVLNYLKEYAQNGGSVLLVTHSQYAAMQADRQIFLNHGNLNTGDRHGEI